MKIKSAIILVGFICGLFVLSCGRNREVKEYDAFSDKKITDSLITDAVEDEISYHPEVPSHLIDVSTKDGIVILSGSVDNLLSKNRAEEVAAQVKGVKGIVNDIIVKSEPVADDVLKRRVEGGLDYDPSTNPWDIDVKVKNGDVFLSGIVGSWQEIRFAGNVAQSIFGVKKVTNNLVFQYDSLRPDDEIYYEIKRIYLTDARLDHSLIKVNVNGGMVSLYGIVGSLPEKSLAIADAWVSGVRSVDASNLEIKYWARDPRLRVDKYVKKSDSEIDSAIQLAYTYDYRVRNYDVTVNVQNGYVTLTGDVKNLMEKEAAKSDAMDIVGVWEVDNRIKVRPDILYSDKDILGRVRSAFENNQYLNKYKFNLNVYNGKLYIDGKVDTPYERLLAEQVADRIPGVAAVKNNLVVSNYFNNYSDFYYKYNYPIIEAPNLLPDDKIKENIERELWRSPFVNSEEIHVNVKDGHVILTGTVETQREKKAAEKNAFEGGAFTVENDITVRYWPN